MKTKKRLKQLDKLLRATKIQLQQADAQTDKSAKRAVDASDAVADAREQLKKAERLLKKERAHQAAKKKAAKKRASKKARQTANKV